MSLRQTKVVVLFSDDEVKIPEKKMDVLPTKNYKKVRPFERQQHCPFDHNGRERSKAWQKPKCGGSLGKPV